MKQRIQMKQIKKDNKKKNKRGIPFAYKKIKSKKIPFLILFSQLEAKNPD